MTMPATITLARLLASLAEVPAALDRPITGLASDSRLAGEGDLFLALRGLHRHGLDFLPDLRRSGVAAIAWEPPYETLPPGSPSTDSRQPPLFAIEQLGRRVGTIAARFHADPCRDLELIGITGTDGKTSTAWYLAQALHQADAPCGLLGTLGYGVWNELLETGLTTPDALTIWRWLAALRERGARHVAMEVSSHALAQGRVDGLGFTVAVLTNLGRDHLDYHADPAEYAAAKRRLFTDFEPCHAVLNLDDAFGRDLAADLGARAIGYGLEVRPDMPRWVCGHDLQLRPEGLRMRIESSWGNGELASGLFGRFNAGNLLAALAALLALEMPLDRALDRLATVRHAPGRMERFGGGDRPLAVVDYAHTPQALEQALQALREHGRGRLWCVFGCGGERDPGKRPLMAAIAERRADRVMITDDNPRREDPDAITAQILTGLQRPHRAMVERDRAAAIRRALREAQPGDSVLIAGKGHEDYQILGQRRVPFSDREIVQDWLGEPAA
jgi:UDP-N-acetylmuramoyl-L-alanyl-D-glutamate--2,6-diaminopimelate ligase